MAVTTVNHDRVWSLLADTFHNPFDVLNNLTASLALARSQYRGDQFATETFIHRQKAKGHFQCRIFAQTDNCHYRLHSHRQFE